MHYPVLTVNEVVYVSVCELLDVGSAAAVLWATFSLRDDV